MKRRQLNANIEGVRVEAQHIVRNNRGHLLEVARSDDQWVKLEQVYLTATHPGVIKAWYRHHQQVDSITIAGGAARLAIYDDRVGSPSFGSVEVLELSLASPTRVLIPPLLWHGYIATGDEDALIIHVNSLAWDSDHPDEDRLAPDDPSMPDVWS